jgi:class 3 adenylate cyclase/tetratricopeptide (TPR) repeat protein
VTILFCDVVGSTELAEGLDPEVVRSIMTRYFDVAKPIVERHGGTVEKFIGDAVMAVFGVPVLHEDDALRAVRAAAELRDASSELEMAVRMGVATGEALTGSGQTLGSGDVFNLAARLQAAASPGEVLISDATLELVRDAVTVDSMPPLTLKGKRREVIAWQLVSIRSDRPGLRRSLGGALVGRDRELQLLRGAFERCQAEGRCHLVTILGDAGIGKSRLAEELVADVGVQAARGRCLAYGDGITYLPLAEVFRGLAGDEPAETWLQRTLAADDDGAHAFDVVAAAVGYSGPGPSAESEIPWAFGRAVESAAGVAPLIVVFDDIQWAEPALLEVIEHMVDWSRSAAILVVCLARTELLESRPTWGGGKVNSTMLLLEPLTAEQSSQQIETLAGARAIDDVLRRRIVETAGGNPLFAEQMVAMLEGGSADEVAVPASVQALLAARIDALDGRERTVLEAAAVEGQEFHQEAVAALIAGDVDNDLQALSRQELIKRQTPSGGRGQVYAFRHLLIRDAAYDSISLGRRAELHTQFADWWERAVPDDAPQFHAILGYHLDTACRCHEKLSEPASAYGELATRAGAVLATAGQLAWRRWEDSARALLSRALELLPAGHELRARALLTLGFAELYSAGARDRMTELVNLGLGETERDGDDVMRLRFQLAQIEARVWEGEDDAIDWRRRQAEDAIVVFERAGEIDGIVQALGLLSLTEQDAMQGERTRAVGERLLEIGRRTDHSVARDGGVRVLALALLDGPVPTGSAIERCRELLETTTGPGRAIPMQFMSELHAARGEFDQARAMLDEAQGITAALGRSMDLTMSQWTEGAIEALAGRWTEAEASLRRLHAGLVETDEGWAIGGVGALLGEVLLEQDRLDEAREFVTAARTHAAPRSIYYQAWWRRAMARVEARDGRHEQAVSLAREALALIERSDWLYFRADAELALADVLRHGGSELEAAEAATRALALCEAKDHVSGARRMRRFLEKSGGSVTR